MAGITDDEMINNWGCNLVNTIGCCRKTFHQLDQHVRSDVPGFKLFSLEASGTASNETAIGEATSFDFSKCLYAMGSYAGGSGQIMTMSTSTYSLKKALSIPMLPEEASDPARIQTVAFPYWVECSKLNDTERRDIETKCLLALQKRLLICRMAGRPYRAIICELILCGNGGELSNNFLEGLGLLAYKFGLAIIVDEVMTGARVGPKMTMTSSAPSSFRNCVEFVTLGKVFNCGVVLKKVPNKPNENDERRGNSTHLEAGEPSMNWCEIQDRLERGYPVERRKQIVSILKVEEKEDNWGKGCLIYTSKSRPWVNKGLKQRLLPMLETKKIRKGPTKQSSWNRSTLCETLKDRTSQWLQHMDHWNQNEWPFITVIVETILDAATTDITPEGIESMLGPIRADEMAEIIRSKVRRTISCRNGKCEKKPKTFIRDAIASAIENCPNVLKRVRVGKKRKLIYKINREAIIVYNNNEIPNM